GVDSIIICIGVPTLVNDALNMARQRGCINIFAGMAAKGWAEVESNLIHYKELEASSSVNSRRADYQTALQLIESGRIKVTVIVKCYLHEYVESVSWCHYWLLTYLNLLSCERKSKSMSNQCW